MTRLLPWFHYIYRASVTKQASMGRPSAKSYAASSYLHQLQQWLTQNFTTLYQSHMLNIINMQCQLCASVCASACVLGCLKVWKWACASVSMSSTCVIDSIIWSHVCVCINVLKPELRPCVMYGILYAHAALCKWSRGCHVSACLNNSQPFHYTHFIVSTSFHGDLK